MLDWLDYHYNTRVLVFIPLHGGMYLLIIKYMSTNNNELLSDIQSSLDRKHIKAWNTRLFLVDISGYTRFLTNTSILHAREVITEILHRVYISCSHTLTLNKIEGDALFFYSRTSSIQDLIWHSHDIHNNFHKTIGELTTRHKVCRYEICHHLDALEIKFILHEGDVVTHLIGDFEELMGVPVIEIHRLLKNNVREKAYILVVSKNGAHSENYEHTGEIKYDLIVLEHATNA